MEPEMHLRLYVAGSSPSSSLARANLGRLLEGRRARVEIVDVFENALEALADGVRLTPTLVRLEPPPRVQIVGDLSRSAEVRAALGLEDAPSRAGRGPAAM